MSIGRTEELIERRRGRHFLDRKWQRENATVTRHLRERGVGSRADREHKGKHAGKENSR
jgi:hypothetical protein